MTWHRGVDHPTADVERLNIKREIGERGQTQRELMNKTTAIALKKF